MTVFQVDVIHTDRTRGANGRYTEFRARVTVLAATSDDACCVAAQLVATIRADLDVMVLASRIVL